MKTRQTRTHQQQGFTITELLIAMTIGLVLITGMISVFVGSKRSAALNSAMADMQESARFALEAISRDARMAGFQGCIDVNSYSAVVRGDDAPTDDLFATVATGSVVVSASNWSPAPLPTFPIPSGGVTAVPGTHTLALQFGSPLDSELSGPMFDAINSLAAPIPLADNRGGITDGDLAIISNCDVADLFRVTVAPTDAGALTHHASDNSDSGNLSRAYGEGGTLEDTRVMKFNSNVYFVGTSGRTNDQGDVIRSLYLQSLPYTAANPPTELVEGIENMRVRFGIRQNNGAMAYFAANESGYDSSRVEAIQLGLLMSSYDRIRNEDDNQTYVLAGIQIPPNENTVTDGLSHPDNRQFRLVFNTTIKIRNRRDKEI